MIGNAPLSHITGVPGWQTHDEQELLYRLATDVPQSGSIVEIGSEYGQSASIFAKATRGNDVRIYCIDLFPDDLIYHHHDNLFEAGLEPNDLIFRYRGNSQTFDVAARTLNDGPFINLLYIDGDHHYKGCKGDILNWSPWVIPGGKMVFHDTATATNPTPHEQHHEVSRAIYDWFVCPDGANWRHVDSVDSIMVFQRKP